MEREARAKRAERPRASGRSEEAGHLGREVRAKGRALSEGAERPGKEAVRFLYLTDIHGNVLILRRALELARERGADLVVLGGDVCCRLDLSIVVSEGGAHLLFDVDLEHGHEVEDPEGTERSLWERGVPCLRVDVAGLERVQGELGDPELGRALLDGLQLRSLEMVAREVASSPAPVLCIPGNDDPEGTDREMARLGLETIHGRARRVLGLTFAGLGCINYTPLHTTNLELTEGQLQRRLASLVRKARPPVVLVAHAPPLNTNLDEVMPGRHVGSSGVREAIKESGPLVSLHGHIHESVGMDRIGATVCANPGSFFEDDLLSCALVEVRGAEVSVEFLTRECGAGEG